MMSAKRDRVLESERCAEFASQLHLDGSVGFFTIFRRTKGD